MNTSVSKVFFLSLLFIFSFHFGAEHVSAQATDQRCFTKEQCQETRVIFGADPQEDGFVTGKQETSQACGEITPNGEKLGFCLPPGKTKTSITFGGRDTFDNFGDFIQYVYRYAIVFAAILAILIIIFSGLQWTASGGNSSTIESAKKRIAGAVTGLILAATSYLILNTINPATVSLRLPQIWMINSIGIAPSTCEEVKDGTKLGLARNAAQPELSGSEKKALLQNTRFFTKEEKSKFECGSEYFVEKSADMTCKGNSCQPGNVCFKTFTKATPSCLPGTIAGTIINKNISAKIGLGQWLGEEWSYPWIKSIGIVGVCRDGRVITSDISGASLIPVLNEGPNETQEYLLSFPPERIDYAMRACEPGNTGDFSGIIRAIYEGGLNTFYNRLESNNTDTGIKGFAIKAVFNESFSDGETHYLGRVGPNAVDLGDSFFFERAKASGRIAPSYFFSWQEMAKGGMNININAGGIPDIDTFSQDTISALEGIAGTVWGSAQEAHAQKEWEIWNKYLNTYGNLLN